MFERFQGQKVRTSSVLLKSSFSHVYSVGCQFQDEDPFPPPRPSLRGFCSGASRFLIVKKTPSVF